MAGPISFGVSEEEESENHTLGYLHVTIPMMEKIIGLEGKNTKPRDQPRLSAMWNYVLESGRVHRIEVCRCTVGNTQMVL